MGATSSPTAVSKGGFDGALGCDRVGTKCLVREKDLAMASDLLRSITFSRAGKSVFYCG